eukprot:15377058-Alexandrium_andersonii.AAC.1
MATHTPWRGPGAQRGRAQTHCCYFASGRPAAWPGRALPGGVAACAVLVRGCCGGAVGLERLACVLG